MPQAADPEKRQKRRAENAKGCEQCGAHDDAAEGQADQDGVGHVDCDRAASQCKSRPESAAKRWGRELFEALFSGPVGELWSETLGTIPGEAIAEPRPAGSNMFSSLFIRTYRLLTGHNLTIIGGGVMRLGRSRGQPGCIGEAARPDRVDEWLEI